jgi:anti-sigma B factor antagonist
LHCADRLRVQVRTMTMGARPPFDVRLERRGSSLLVVPTGELDLFTTPQLATALHEQHGYDELVLDLRGLAFMDSSGLRLLVAEHERAQREGHALRIVRGVDQVHRVLHLTRLDERLPIVEPDEIDAAA